ncbi:MAG: M23 family metallopeptidase [Bacillaceae bacterium]|nr:M23 family metallopeptidase [Bacillaceae bacterium]
MKNRDIHRIRKNIALRKKAKKSNRNQRVPSSSYNYSVNEEEKHGFYPFASDQSSSTSQNVWLMSILLKTLLAGILFFSIAIIFQINHDRLERPKEYLRAALTREFPFATVQTWYRDHFGAPFSLVSEPTPASETTEVERVLPVNGMIAENGNEGVKIISDEQSKVFAMDEGTVIFAGKKKSLGNTVIIQHTDGTNSIYGNLDEIHVYLYEFISRTESIGTISPDQGEEASLIFAVKKGDKYVNPIKVMKVDEGS